MKEKLSKFWNEHYAKYTARDWVWNVVLYLIGVGLMPLGVVLTVNSHLGAGGYDALNFALGEKLGINTSLAIYMTAIIAVILAAIIRRKAPRITTFISSFFLGIFTDLWKSALQGIQGSGWVDSIVILLIGLVIVAFAVAAYILCIFPSNPTDDLVAAAHERGARLGVAKICLDVFCVVVAFIMGGEIGVGTIVCTFGLGPVVDFFFGFLKKFTDRQGIQVS